MRKIEFEIITLDWVKIETDKLYTLTGISGIYQIYGTSPLYGVDTLLYIGQAKDLSQRLSTHIGGIELSIGRQPNKSIKYAKLKSELLTIVEETLIVMYKPSFNSNRLNNICHEATIRPIYIQNHGERGMLNYENTNFYFLNQSLIKEINIEGEQTLLIEPV